MSQQVQKSDGVNYSPYCRICGACGEEGYCSPLSCKNHSDGNYCNGYMDDLKFGYAMYDDIMKIIDGDSERYKELKEEIDKKFDKNFDIYYSDRYKPSEVNDDGNSKP